MNKQLEEKLRQNSSGHGKGGLIYGRKLEDWIRTDRVCVHGGDDEARRRPGGGELSNVVATGRRREGVVRCKVGAGVQMRNHRAYLAACRMVCVRKVQKCQQVSMYTKSIDPVT